MNIDITAKINKTQTSTDSQNTKQNQKESEVKFSDELKTVSKEKSEASDSSKENLSETQKAQETQKTQEKQEKQNNEEDVQAPETSEQNPQTQEESLENAVGGLENAVNEISKLNRTDENLSNILKTPFESDDNDNKNEDLGLIDNNMNIQEPKDKLNAQMNANMNFNSNGQPFAEFISNEQTKEVLRASAKDIAEEKEILSTMEENIAIANKNMAINESQNKTVINEHGIKKVNKETNITVDTIASFDSVIMDKNDVDFFAKLVNEGTVNFNEVTNASRSSAVSKTLADLLAKAMNENKPVRIDFDNNISVIIKISKDGKLSADFLPSSNIAEAYLRDNLPLLRQKFDENNIDYEELNQRKQKQNENDNRKKDRKNE